MKILDHVLSILGIFNIFASRKAPAYAFPQKYQKYHQVSLAGRSYLPFPINQFSNTSIEKRTRFSVIATTERKEGILLSAIGENQGFFIFIQNFLLGVLIKFPDTKPFMYLSRKIKLKKNFWHLITVDTRVRVGVR